MLVFEGRGIEGCFEHVVALYKMEVLVEATHRLLLHNKHLNMKDKVDEQVLQGLYWMLKELVEMQLHPVAGLEILEKLEAYLGLYQLL